MVVASPPIVVASTASNTTALPDGAAPSAAPCAATASAAVSSPAAMPRRRAAVVVGSAGTVASDHAEASHQIGVDAVELLADRIVGGPAIRRRHVLGSRDRRRQVGESIGHRGDELLGLGVLGLLGDLSQCLLGTRDAGGQLRTVAGELAELTERDSEPVGPPLIEESARSH